MVKHAAFAVPGNLDTPTGGYAYDKRIIAELERMGDHDVIADFDGEQVDSFMSSR